MNSELLYENILEKHKKWKKRLIIVFILVILILIFVNIAGNVARDLAYEEGDFDLIESIRANYIFGSLLLAGLVTFIAFLLYEQHMKKIPEIRDENLKNILFLYSIFFGLFYLSYITSIGIIIPYIPIAFLAVIITFNILLIDHSIKVERAIGEISKVRTYYAYQASSIHRQLKTDRKYCSTCQYPLKYNKNYNRYYCEVCKKFEV